MKFAYVMFAVVGFAVVVGANVNDLRDGRTTKFAKDLGNGGVSREKIVGSETNPKLQASGSRTGGDKLVADRSGVGPGHKILAVRSVGDNGNKLLAGSNVNTGGSKLI